MDHCVWQATGELVCPNKPTNTSPPLSHHVSHQQYNNYNRPGSYYAYDSDLHDKTKPKPGYIHFETGDQYEAPFGHVNKWTNNYKVKGIPFGTPNITSLRPYKNRVNPKTNQHYPAIIVPLSEQAELRELALPIHTFSYEPSTNTFVLNAEGLRRKQLLIKLNAGLPVDIPGTAKGSSTIQMKPDRQKRQQLCIKRWLKGYDQDIYANRLTDYPISTSKTNAKPWINSSLFNSQCMVQPPNPYSIDDIGIIEAYGLYKAPFTWTMERKSVFNPVCTKVKNDSDFVMYLPSSGTCKDIPFKYASSKEFRQKEFCPKNQVMYYEKPWQISCKPE